LQWYSNQAATAKSNHQANSALVIYGTHSVEVKVRVNEPRSVLGIPRDTVGIDSSATSLK